jgi:perosamine synthetase
VITTGQGGALITDDDGLALAARKIKDFGRERGGVDWHDMMGYNFKFTDLQAVIGIEQMKKLPWRVTRKKQIYRLYEEQLSNVVEVEMIPTAEDTAPWFMDIYVPDPSVLLEFLKKSGVGSRPVYPPISKQRVYAIPGTFPVSESYCSRGLWLPSSSFLKDETIIRICDLIRTFYRYPPPAHT